MKQILSCDGDGLSENQELSAFYGNWKFIIVFTTALHVLLFWVTWTQSASSYHISLKPILILFSYLYIGIPSGLLPSGFPPKNIVQIFFQPLFVFGYFNFSPFPLKTSKNEIEKTTVLSLLLYGCEVQYFSHIEANTLTHESVWKQRV